MHKYAVLIRTYDSAKMLPGTLRAIQEQTVPPIEYVIVDSGSTDHTLNVVPDSAHVHQYVGAEFNYSDAINQGLIHVTQPYVLILSAHTVLSNPEAMAFALDVLSGSDRLGAAYFCGVDGGVLQFDVVDIRNFNGFNGLWNTCSVIKTSLLRKRGFRPDVFAAEDQEWAHWLFTQQHQAVARISGGGMKVMNPRKFSRKKRLNEYLCIAYFANRRLMSWRNIAAVAVTAFRPPISRLPLSDRVFKLALVPRLIACRFFKPRSKSRYF